MADVAHLSPEPFNPDQLTRNHIHIPCGASSLTVDEGVREHDAIVWLARQVLACQGVIVCTGTLCASSWPAACCSWGSSWEPRGEGLQL